jgi:YVTN family beta-propeller protein
MNIGYFICRAGECVPSGTGRKSRWKLFLLFFSLAISVHAAPIAVTGQWDFKYGDLRATVGADLQYVGDTSNVTSFTIAKINGQPAQVMSFGGNSVGRGFYMRHGAAPNGGGQFVNQYTIVMDVMYSTINSSQLHPLLQSDPFNPPGIDAQFYVGSNQSAGPDGIGANDQFSGTLSANVWYRIAFAVDLTAPSGQQLTKYVNGTMVGSQSLAGGVDGHYALGPTAQLFTTGTATGGATTQPGYVNSIQFLNGCLSPQAILVLGGPTANGIQSGAPRLQITTANTLMPATKFIWPGRYSPNLQIQQTTNLADPASWQSVGLVSSTQTLEVPTAQLNIGSAGTVSFFRVGGPFVTNVDPGATVEGDISVNWNGVETQVVPTKQILHTPGKSVLFGGLGLDIALSPDGTTAYVKNNNSLIVVDVATWKRLQSVRYPGSLGSFHGIAVSTDGMHVYVTASAYELYDFAIATNRVATFSRTIALPAYCDPCGIALSADGTNAYVCLNKSNSIAIVNLAIGMITGQIKVGMAPWGIALSPNGNTAYVSDWGGRVPVKGDLTLNSAGSQIVVDARGIAASGTLSVVDLTQNLEVAEIPTGLHPSDVTLSQDGSTLYVANANSDTVTVINTQTLAVQETILMRPDPSLPFGSASDAVTLSPDGTILYVANGGNNAVAVVELPNGQHTNSIILGFIPTDWYPGALATDGTNLFIANTKGQGSANGTAITTTGTVDKIPLPTPEVLDKYTAQVQENSRVPQMLQTQLAPVAGQAPVPVPVHTGEPSVFQHVLYVIKENKTYDQMFGDIPQGNGASNLCIYPQVTTPNHHALATQFVLLDNYYCNGVYSTDGHAWCTEANATDYFEKGIGALNRAGQIGADPLMYSSSGFIWNNVLQHGLTFHNHGVFGQAGMSPASTWLQVYSDYANQTGLIGFYNSIGNAPVLPKYSSTNVSGFNLSIPDQIRADGFLREFNTAQSSGVWPTFNMLYLPDDHTAGSTVGYPTPRAQLADNDLALGRVIEAVTKSIFWTNTVIFVIEDDAQGGYDHVDGHRSICLVISPYTKRAQTVSTFFNQTGLIHTMEQIMGLPPMNQMDAMGPLMGDCFMAQPDYTPYTALPNQVALNEMNPGTLSSMSRQDLHWARLSAKQDFSKADVANDDELNRIIWHSVKGNARYPSEYVGPHGKGLKTLGLIVSKNHHDDDDDD